MTTKQEKKETAFMVGFIKSEHFLSVIEPLLQSKKKSEIYGLKNFLKMLSKLYDREHKIVNGAFSFSKNDLVMAFGFSQYRKIVKGEHYFNKFFTKKPLFTYSGCGYTGAYFSTELLENVISEVIELQEEEENPYRQFKRRLKDNFYNEPKQLSVPDVYLSETTFTLSDKARQSPIVRRYMVFYSPYFKGSNLRQFYAEKEGRLYGAGFNLQTVKRVHRKEFLKGKYDHDFQACAPTILYQEYLSQGNDSLPEIEALIANRRALREGIAIRSGASVKWIKQAITALFFGATGIKHGTNLYSEILADKNNSKVEANKLIKSIEQDEIFSELIKEVAHLFGVIRVGECENNYETKKQAVARFYRDKEREALELSISYLNENNNPALLYFHDGFVTAEKVNNRELEESIFAQIGYGLKLESEFVA